MPLWLDELQAIDQLDATPQRFNNGIIVAALLTIRRRGQSAIDCLDKFQRDAGVKSETTMDGVEGLFRLSFAGNAGGSASATLALVNKAISCIEAACEKREFLIGGKGGGRPRSTNAARYCAGMRAELKRPFEKLLVEVQKADAEQQRMCAAERRRYVPRGPSRLN